MCHSDFAAKLLGGYSEKELAAAFNKVAPKPNWKAAVAAVLPAETSPREIKKIVFAISFYTGSEATVRSYPNGHVVTAPGYYAAVGA